MKKLNSSSVKICQNINNLPIIKLINELQKGVNNETKKNVKESK